MGVGRGGEFLIEGCSEGFTLFFVCDGRRLSWSSWYCWSRIVSVFCCLLIKLSHLVCYYFFQDFVGLYSLYIINLSFEKVMCSFYISVQVWVLETMCFEVFTLELLELSYVGSYFSEGLIPPWFGCWARVALLHHLLISAYYCCWESWHCIFEVSDKNRIISIY